MEVESDVIRFESPLTNINQKSSFTAASSSSTYSFNRRPLQVQGLGPLRINSKRESSSSFLDQTPELPGDRHHYSKNLYSVLDDGLKLRRKCSTAASKGNYSILESLEVTQSMIVTKQALRKYQNSRMIREERFVLHTIDENLDFEAPFQSEGFSLNVQDPNVLEFNLQTFYGDEENPTSTDGKISESLEQKFDDKMFNIVLTEDDKTRRIGSVKQKNGAYHIFDSYEKFLFYLENVHSRNGRNKMSVFQQNRKKKIEIASIEIGEWKMMTLETEIIFSDKCTAKEKLLILGTVLIMMMKIPSRRALRGDIGGPCSIGSFWKDIFSRMQSAFTRGD